MRKTITILFLILFSYSFSYTQEVNKEKAVKVAKSFMVKHGSDYQIAETLPIIKNNELLGYQMNLNPVGYLILSANTELRPVLAYSFTNNLIDNEGTNVFLEILKEDLSKRIIALPFLKDSYRNKNRYEWNSLAYNKMQKGVSYFPNKKGDGFLETNWTQNHPYNMLCPLDIVNGGRSVAGCPATAMSMILNYHKETNLTQFDDNDDYYHNFYDQFYIDDDFETYGFPSFPQLNIYINQLQNCYNSNFIPNDTLIAALNFACGVAATQVYSASISGTYGVNQAYEAYQKFNFEESELLMGGDTSIVSRMIENMMYELPVHLALVDPAGTVGHNVVTDGYNSDGYFHLNFGWGGSSNGWYTMPPTSIPYNLTVIEGVVLDINYDSTAPPPQSVIADFDASETSIIEGDAIDFTDLSLNNPDSWQWTFEGGSPSTATIQNPHFVTYQEPGVYSVKLVAWNAFSQDSVTKEGYITVEPDAVNSVKENSVSIFPTRTKEKVYIENSSNEASTLELYDLTGRKVYSSHFVNKTDLNLRDYNSGIYILSLRSESSIITKKIIKD